MNHEKHEKHEKILKGYVMDRSEMKSLIQSMNPDEASQVLKALLNDNPDLIPKGI